MRVLVACEYSGRVRDAFRAAGHDAMSCDMLPTEADGPHYQGDVRDILGDGWDLMIGHPPCTRLANSGVRWLHEPPPGKTKAEMWADLDAAAEFYRTLRDAPIPRKALENPVMHCHARERIGNAKRHVVQPWWFGEPVFKATGFELIGLPPLVPTNKLVPPKAGTPEHKAWSWVHRLPPSEDRWKHRSRTFNGIAQAMADQWGAVTHNAPAHLPPVGCTVTPDVRKEIDVDTKPYREKYAKRKHGRNMAYPPGGEDVHSLCDTVDRLIWLLREIQAELPTDGQNEVERRLWNI